MLLDLVGEVVGLLDLGDLRQGMVDALARAIPCKFSSLNEIGPDGVVGLVRPQLEEHWYVKFGELAHENPLYQRWLRTKDGRAYRFSDVTTREELESTRLFQEFYRPLGVNHQIAITLPGTSDRVLAIVLNREHGDFTDDERDLLNRARPFLIQAYRNAVAYTLAKPPDPQATLVAHGLTPRQAEVLGLVALGGSNRDVADRLGLSDRTVQKHLENAYRVLGVATRSEAAARVWELTGEPGPFAGEVVVGSAA